MSAVRVERVCWLGDRRWCGRIQREVLLPEPVQSVRRGQILRRHAVDVTGCIAWQNDIECRLHTGGSQERPTCARKNASRTHLTLRNGGPVRRRYDVALARRWRRCWTRDGPR